MLKQKPLYQANSNFVLRNIAGTEVLVAVGAGVADFRGYITMNPSAVAIWNALQNKVSEDEITDILLERFDVEREELAADVRETLDMLVGRNMVMVYAE